MDISIPQRTRVTITEVACATLIFVLISVASGLQQEARWRPVLEGDALEYYEMTRQFHAGRPLVRGTGPFVYRIGVPWLAGLATRPQIERYLPFYLINITSAFIVSLLLLFWLRRFVQSSFVRVLMVAAYIAAWHAPARFVYFYPVYVDPLFLVALVTALILMDAPAERWSSTRTSALLLTILLGMLVRESMAMVAVAAAFAPGFAHQERWRSIVWRAAPIGAAAAAWLMTRRVGVLSDPYSPAAEPVAMLVSKPIFTWVLGWFFAFGPSVVALIAANGRRIFEIFRGRPHLVVFSAGCLVASFFGGTDTERIAAWAAPIVYVLAGRAIERFTPILGYPPLWAVLAAAQAISARIFWPIPSVSYNVEPYVWSGRWVDAYEAFNRLVVIHTHYTYLWSYFGSRAWHLALLSYDVVFVGLIAWWMWAREARAARRPAALDSQ